ncbi:hypothetical protein VSS74_12290 [Conexibacter stalactiti]|uniref:Uncharacterized protein n=1 Tax=Conexibacter stalactiti TaxID=1940611 RepID=A0ABU4HPC8_9ACTN|nr:hypothetical protein [Conexibacter stalactiti]MDW5595122.1 hypothetical protein [Conexibacter stalactiti]MEC5035764.1 hypothetical protein [Conexibacter stalactiti]
MQRSSVDSITVDHDDLPTGDEYPATVAATPAQDPAMRTLAQPPS